ncbi:hypothetical protein BH18ACT9_BH18ACT9_07960 [soil metagenome]
MSTTTRPAGRGRRWPTIAAATGLLLLAAVASAYTILGWGDATDDAMRNRTPPSPVSAGGPSATPSASPSASASAHRRASSQEMAPNPTPVPVPPPEPVLEPGDQGRQVRELQARLSQLDWFEGLTTQSYGPVARSAVSGFQGKRGFEATGVVDERTWQRLVEMTYTPTPVELFNRPGPTLYGPGDSGSEVRKIQARLRQIAWFFGDVSDFYGSSTTSAVTGFQGKRGIPETGEVDRRTLDLLVAMSTEPTADELANRKPKPEPEEEPEPATEVAASPTLDPRCMSGQVLCIDKTTQSLRWVVEGEVLATVDVRFGSDELPTREGEFSVFSKSRDHVSSLYDTSMPFAMFFSGGQAVHYSPDFAATGYTGASHGCVNVRDYDTIAALFDQVPLGAKVVIYWS